MNEIWIAQFSGGKNGMNVIIILYKWVYNVFM